MANFDFNFEELLDEQMAQLDNFDEIAEKMIFESLPTLERIVKKESEGHIESREMIDSIKSTKVTKGKNGWFAVVRPTGKDKKGVRNMEKMAYLEYGTSKQNASPVLSVAVSKARQPIAELMQQIYNKEVEK